MTGITKFQGLYPGTSIGLPPAPHTHTEADVTSLVADLAGKQPLDADLTAFAAKTAPSGAVVGTSDAQALTNKDLTGAGNTFPTLNQNTTGSAAKWTTARTLAITGDLAYTSPSLDGTGNVTAAGTLATVNGNVGSFGSATQVATFTVDSKGRLTAAANATIAIPESAVTNLVTDLAAKATDTAVVHLAGTETITGTKTVDVALVQTYQGSTPATPAAGKATGPYFGSDGLPYFLTPTGVVVPFSIGEVGTALHGNASFETVSGSTPTIWDTTVGAGGTFTTETTDVLFGTRSATVATSAGTNFQFLISDVFTVAAGDTLSIGAWAHQVTGSPKIEIGVLTAVTGTPAFFDGVSTVQFSEKSTLAATFTKYGKTFLVPAGHTVARLYFRFDPTASEATSSRVDFTTSSRTGASTSVLPGNAWVKEACRLLTTAAFAPTTAAPNPVDGATPAVGDRILKAVAGGASTDGIWTVVTPGSGSNGVWARASDASTAAQVAGAEVAITAGTTYGGTQWATTFKSTDTFGTTAMVWAPLVTSANFGGVTLNLTGAWGTAAATGTSGTSVASLPAGVLRGTATCTAYNNTTATPVVEFYIDGVLQGSCKLGPNHSGLNVHTELGAVAFQRTITAGTHYFYFRKTVGFSDTDDVASVSGTILPA